MKVAWLVWAGAMAIVAGLAVGCSESSSVGDGGSGGTAGIGGSGGAAMDCGASAGELLSSEPRSELGMLMWDVRYTSCSIDGTPIEVTGMVAAPLEAPANGLRDVISYAHGTTGVSDPCAPSVQSTNDFSGIAQSAIEAGYVAVATDYEGLGTPGLHPFYVRESEGRGVIDIVRAAQELEDAHAGNRVVVWGNSQGGHASLSAGEVASAGWSPEVEVLGVAAGAPGSGLVLLFEEGAGSPPARGFLWQMVLGFVEVYPQLNLEDVFEPEALEVCLALVEDEACNAEFRVAASPFVDAGFKTNPADIPEWREVLEENSPGHVQSEMPILLIHGDEDTVVPPRYSDTLFELLCATGSVTDYRVIEGEGHDAFWVNLEAVVDWTADRFEGKPPTDSCP